MWDNDEDGKKLRKCRLFNHPEWSQ
jgi:hypothetical protein